ncbi:hypothetical protein H2200_007830 [Cladophialophora chaetospira]|uniref:SGNH hydrolase-type esterase domain-containing protein n=1 Tax=Cladophialophora chaetospira TaxID=386627 RepID=A0AA39CGU7_9EURO|nr:hypothetical protein H2200_007830 [Cladophialophora chaetospira]
MLTTFLHLFLAYALIHPSFAMPLDVWTNATLPLLEERTSPKGDWSSPPVPSNNVNGKTFLDYIILGESFASGPGAGAVFPGDTKIGGKDCVRRVGAWGSQLFQSSLFQNSAPNGYGVPQEHFLACSGADTDFIRQQEPWSTSIGTAGVTVLSTGGNDVEFGKILRYCFIYREDNINNRIICDDLLSKVNGAVFGENLYNAYFALIDGLYNGMKWSARPGSGVVRATALYQTAYPQFFEEYTTQCDNVHLGFPFVSPYAVQSLRQKINSGTQLLNSMMAYWIDQVNVKYGAYPQYFMKQVNPDWQFTGHRFCDPAFTEPYYGPNGYWFQLSAAADSSAGVSASSPAPGKTSDYAQWNPQTCNPDGITDDDWYNALGCEVAQMIANGTAPNPLPSIASGSGGSFDKTFHPRILGHGAIASQLQEALRYQQGQSPSGQNLRIMAIGDSITAGFKSSEGSGFRKGLYDILSQGNSVSFVGSQLSGTSNAPWTASEGRSGYTTDQIYQVVLGNPVGKYQPNVVILMIGTNDIDRSGGDPQSVTNALNNLRLIINTIQSTKPDISLIVGHIPPNGNSANFGPTLSTLQKLVITYNAGINQLVNQLNSQNAGKYKKILVHHTTCSDNPIDKADALHPNDRGYAKLASDFAEAISIVSNAGLISAPSAVTTPSDPQHIPCNDKPNWIPNGQIANGAGLGKNRYPDITCTKNPSGSGGQCYCVNPLYPSTDARYSYVLPLTGDDCSQMSYTLINAVHFADLDGDGYQDYLWVGPGGQVQLFQNGGPKDRSQTLDLAQVIWYPRGEIASGVGGERQEIQFGDLNGDGRADYLWVHANGSVSAWINGGLTVDSNGKGSVGWLPQGIIASGIGAPGSHITFADLNGDGRVEYLAVNSVGNVEAYLNANALIDNGPNAGHRNWIPQGFIFTTANAARNNTQFADMDGDGRADYLQVTVSGSGQVLEWKNNGGADSGTRAAVINWSPIGSLTGGDGSSGANVMFADLDGDGRAEYLEVDPNTSGVTAYFNGCPGVVG